MVFIIHREHEDKLPEMFSDLIQCITRSQLNLNVINCKLVANAEMDTKIVPILSELFFVDSSDATTAEGQRLLSIDISDHSEEESDHDKVDSSQLHCCVCQRVITGRPSYSITGPQSGITN
jgi:hypothetical protein